MNIKFNYEIVGERSVLGFRRDYGVAVLESQPQVRHLLLGHHYYCLSLPYQYFIIHYSKSAWWWMPLSYTVTGLSLGMSRKPISSLDDKLSDVPLPGCERFCSVCLGSGPSIRARTRYSACWKLVDFFWKSSFYSGGAAWGTMSFSQWQQWTTEDPSFIFRMPWAETTPLKSVISYYIKD